MSARTSASARTLADHIFTRAPGTDLALIAGGAALVALAAQLSIPLWPVPITAQTLAVLLVGASLGAVRGALSLTLYVLLGAVGLPIFAGGSSGLEVLTGNSGGFLVGFIVAAGLAGWLAQRGWDRRLPTLLAALGIAATLPFVIGLPWLAFWLGNTGRDNDLHSVLSAGLYPFIIGELVKVAVATALLWLSLRRAKQARQQQADDAE